MTLAAKAMIERPLQRKRLRYVEACWLISEETEDLADYAAAHVDDCWPSLCYLAHSPYQAVRWQVYTALASAGTKAEPLLRRGLDDPHPYCRRRAILSLSTLYPRDAAQLAQRFIGDADPYLRLATIELLRAAPTNDAVRTMTNQLLMDPVDFVQKAAHTLSMQ